MNTNVCGHLLAYTNGRENSTGIKEIAQNTRQLTNACPSPLNGLLILILGLEYSVYNNIENQFPKRFSKIFWVFYIDSIV